MFDEMRFLFSVDPSLRNRLGTNRTVNNENPVESVDYSRDINEDDDTKIDINTYIINRDGVRNYIQSDVNKAYRNEKNNPYLDLIRFTNEPETAKSLKLKSSDFAYLRDIGVMPLNRLMILRRFPEGVIVPVDLNQLDVEPISVVIGWVKADTNLFDFHVGESWESDNTMLHQRLREIIKSSFGTDIGNFGIVPGWGVGFIFQILNEMGLTSYNKDRLPLGDPNLLREAISRPPEQFGLRSSFNFTFETVYEQKYIAGIDPTVSTFDIINNLLTMGTSDTRFMGKKGSDLIEDIRKANESYNDSNAWLEVSSKIITKFIDALKSAGSIIRKDLAEIGGLSKPKDQTQETSDDTDTKSNDEDKVGFMENLLNTSIAQTIIASTIGKYQWPIRASISMLTGDPTTPWHLTIGNPYAPIISMNNIYASRVDIKGGNEMGHNDLPKILQVQVTLQQGRNLGKQEVFEMFGVNYKRRYNKTQNNNI